MKQKEKIQRSAPLSKVVSYVILTFWAITTAYPFLWVILNSFRVRGEIRSDSFSIPWPWTQSFTFDNYITANRRSDFAAGYTNSIVISVIVTLVVVLLAGLFAYGMVRYRFRGQRFVHGMIIAAMMFPVFSTIIPVFRMEVMWGIASTQNRWLSLLSTILPQIAGNLAFAIVVLMGFIRSVPIDLEEAAYLDGCNVFQIYSRSSFRSRNPRLQRSRFSPSSGRITTCSRRHFSCDIRRRKPLRS
ncbi:MAG: carbohydrate ABC transporter permease [Eubacteriales bacterium]